MDWDEWKPFAVMAILTILLFGGIFVLTNLLEYYGCHKKAAALELQCEWGIWTGCIVTRQDGVKVDIDNYGRADRD